MFDLEISLDQSILLVTLVVGEDVDYWVDRGRAAVKQSQIDETRLRDGLTLLRFRETISLEDVDDRAVRQSEEGVSEMSRNFFTSRDELT